MASCKSSGYSQAQIKKFASLGLIDPVKLPNGTQVFFDKKEQKYYDPKTDIYMSNQEIMDMLR